MSETSSEARTISRTEEQLGGPVTYQRLVEDLRRLGIPEGRPIIIHSSLSALGWVAGGPIAVVDALVDAFGPTTTLVMPPNRANTATRCIGRTRRYPNTGSP
jgi:aminoglycoside 3-N-acetyltransferase